MTASDPFGDSQTTPEECVARFAHALRTVYADRIGEASGGVVAVQVRQRAMACALAAVGELLNEPFARVVDFAEALPKRCRVELKNVVREVCG